MVNVIEVIMKSLKYLFLVLIVLLCCSVSYGQCPGGVCKEPAKKTVSVLKKTTTKVVIKSKTVAKKRFLRWRAR